MIARLLSRQGPGAEAEQAWRALIQCNPDNTGYYHGFFKSQNIELGKIILAFGLIYSSASCFHRLQELLQTLSALLRCAFCKIFQCRILVPLLPDD
jgi:hypothetical protein